MTFSLSDLASLAPLVILAFGALGLLSFDAFYPVPSNKYALPCTVIVFLLALFSIPWTPHIENALLTPWIQNDFLSKQFTIFILISGLFTIFLSDHFFKQFHAPRGEFLFLVLSSIFGLILMVSSADFLTLFIGLETLSISLYLLCGYMKKWTLSQESSIKYFLMGSLGAAFLLYGIALVYGGIGTTHFDHLQQGYLTIKNTTDKTLFLMGIGFITIGLAFKVAIVPFHTWAPDAYDGASTPITALMAVGTKAGIYAVFIRIFLLALPQFDLVWNHAVALLAFPTLIYANYVAIQQVQLRRFFAYSGISHSGFLLIPLAAGTASGIDAIIYYLFVYAFATFGCFSVLTFLDDKSEGVMLSDLKGLFKRSPLLGGVMTLCLLTLAGIPPTAGFFAKFYVLKIGYEAGYYSLVIVALLTTILSAYYYLRIVALMFTSSEEKQEYVDWAWPTALVSGLSVVGIIFYTFAPG